MRIGVITILAALLLGVGMSACGGDDDGDTDTTPAADTTAPADTTEAVDTTEPADTTPATAGAATPDAVLSCLDDAGLAGTSEPSIGVAAIHIDVPPQNRIIIDFFEDPAEAKSYSDDQDTVLSAAAGGNSEVIGGTAVVAVAKPGAEQELSTVEGCLGS